MKSPPGMLRTGWLILSLLLISVQQGRSQSYCDEAVTVRIFPLDNPVLQQKIERNASIVLTAINRQSYQRATNISTDAAQKVVAEVMGKYCTRRNDYNGLLVPFLTEEARYEVRGLHLVSKEDGIERLPQAVLTFDGTGLIVDVDVVDRSRRGRDHETVRDEAGRLKRGEEVLDLILAIEYAYNQQDSQQIIKDIREGFANASIIVSRLSSSGQATNKSLGGNQYASNLRQAIKGRALEITYENIKIFQHLDENDEPVEDLYRATVLQHWMYPENGYQDSDYISFDVQFLPEHAFYVRRAGRGGLTLETSPPGATITQVNNQPTVLKTPYYFENIPQQYHYLVVGGVWFETDMAKATPDQIAERDTIRLFLKHKPAQLQILTNPPDSRLSINGVEHAGFQSGQLVTIPPEVLLSAMEAKDLEKTNPGNTRQVRLNITRPYYEDFEQTVTIQTPEPIPLEFELIRLRGILNVTTSPDASEVLINAEPAGLASLSTMLDVTGDDRAPYMIGARNDTCFPGNANGDCIQHIPSVPQPVSINQEKVTNLNIELMPFYVRNRTKNGGINVSLDRDKGSLLVNYALSDKKARDRKYNIQMSLMDEQGNETQIPNKALFCMGKSNLSCVGKAVRPGKNGFAWPLEIPKGSVPVLTLSDKNTCWACVLLPVVAGAAAYIWFGEGSGGPDDTFTPPPRPGDF